MLFRLNLFVLLPNPSFSEYTFCSSKLSFASLLLKFVNTPEGSFSSSEEDPEVCLALNYGGYGMKSYFGRFFLFLCNVPSPKPPTASLILHKLSWKYYQKALFMMNWSGFLPLRCLIKFSFEHVFKEE